jgi:hypothetical protein
MADGVEREAKFKDAALILAEDVKMLAGKFEKTIRGRQYERAEALAATIQRTARDAKWLMQRLPRG